MNGFGVVIADFRRQVEKQGFLGKANGIRAQRQKLINGWAGKWIKGYADIHQSKGVGGEE